MYSYKWFSSLIQACEKKHMYLLCVRTILFQKAVTLLHILSFYMIVYNKTNKMQLCKMSHLCKCILKNNYPSTCAFSLFFFPWVSRDGDLFWPWQRMYFFNTLNKSEIYIMAPVMQQHPVIEPVLTDRNKRKLEGCGDRKGTAEEWRGGRWGGGGVERGGQRVTEEGDLWRDKKEKRKGWVKEGTHRSEE